jgi:hypothetical protein
MVWLIIDGKFVNCSNETEFNFFVDKLNDCRHIKNGFGNSVELYVTEKSS